MQIVHLSIDVQRRFTAVLQGARRRAFLQNARALALDLRGKGVATIWVGLGHESVEGINHVHLHQPMRQGADEKRRASLIRKLGLQDLAPRADEAILCKLENGAFCDDRRNKSGPSLLEAYLRFNNVSKILVSGLNTRGCVMETLIGGMKRGFEMVALYDKMADLYAFEEERNPSWHKEKLDAILPLHAANGGVYEVESARKIIAKIPAVPYAPLLALAA